MLECHTKDILTSGVGTFSFTLSAQSGLSYIYTDIGNNYKAKIHFGYDGSYTHLFTGKILSFTSGITSSIATRVYEGKSLSEILERIQMENIRWQNVDAIDIVYGIAAYLGISSDADIDTTDETITVRTESCFDILRKVSDYWYDADTQVQKDFYVNKDNVLVWKARPIRTSGVESLTYGEDFLGYNLKYDILGAKNNINILGALTAPIPPLKDEWSDSLTDWHNQIGSITLDDNDVKAGTYKIVGFANNTALFFYRDIPRQITRHINTLNFWFKQSATNPTMRILAPDTSNYFYKALTGSGWQWFNDAVGDGTEYDVDENPTGWNKFGNANWYDMQGIGYAADTQSGAQSIEVDKIYFFPERWVSYAEDNISRGIYGERDAEFTDENLLSDTECLKRANTILYQLKDRVLRLDFTVKGNTNILIGDRLPLTLPPDNISAVPFDVVSVEHHYSKEPLGYQTTVHLVDSVNTRQLPPITPLESIQRNFNNTKEVTAEIYSRVVR